jgi:hypothetical protein
MAKYNILSDNDDFADITKNPPEKDIAQKSIEENLQMEVEKFSPSPVENKKQTPGDDYFSDEIFPSKSKEKTEISIADDDPFKIENSKHDSELTISPSPETNSLTGYEETGVGEYPAEIGKAKKQPLFAYDEDDTQTGINYKPIIIGISAVAAIVVLYLLISNLFFPQAKEEITEQKVESAAEKLEREQTERKQNFLAEINRDRRTKLSGVTFLTGLEKENVKYSSILLYGNSLDFEIFVPNRDVLAKYNIKIKGSHQIEKYKIEKVDFRPGKSGGLFALYNIDIKSESNILATASPSLQTFSPDTWVGTILQQTGVTVKAQRSIFSRQENLFRLNRVEYNLKGSLQSFLSLIERLATTDQNLSIHKLSLLPADQRKMSPSSYVLKLIVDFHL